MLLLSLLFRAGSHCGTPSNSLVSLLYIIAPKCLQFHLLSLFKKHHELGPPGKYALGAQVKSNTLANCLYSGHNVEPLDCQKERPRLNEDKDVMSAFFSFFSFSRHYNSSILQGNSCTFSIYRVWENLNPLQNSRMLKLTCYLTLCTLSLFAQTI